MHPNSGAQGFPTFVKEMNKAKGHEADPKEIALVEGISAKLMPIDRIVLPTGKNALTMFGDEADEVYRIYARHFTKEECEELPEPFDAMTARLFEEAEHNIKGFKRMFTGSPDPEFVRDDYSRSVWSIYSTWIEGAPGPYHIFNTGVTKRKENAEPSITIECRRSITPLFFMNNVTGAVFGVVDRVGNDFRVLHLGFGSKCKNTGPFQTCVHHLD